IERTVGSDLQIGRAKVRIARKDDRLFLDGGEARSVVGNVVAQDTLKADDVRHEQIALHVVGEMPAAEDFERRAGARPLLIDLWRFGMFHGVIDMTREERSVIRNRARAVDYDILPPAIENVAVRIRKAERDIGIERLRPRLVAIDAGVGIAKRLVPGRFNLRLVEGALLEVERAARIKGEAVGGVMRVGRVEAMQQPDANISFVVAIGVFKKNEVRRLGNNHAAAPKLEAGWIVEVVSKRRLFVGAAVAVSVF